jgi:hypothetical protein
VVIEGVRRRERLLPLANWQWCRGTVARRWAAAVVEPVGGARPRVVQDRPVWLWSLSTCEHVSACASHSRAEENYYIVLVAISGA